MRLSRPLRVALTILALIAGLAAVFIVSLWFYFHPSFQRTAGIAYGQRGTHELTFDLLRPTRPNGVGVVLIVSGGWQSRPGSFEPWIAAPLLRRGYTLFCVYHVSQPEATVMEIAEDVNRAVRFVRFHAKDYGIDPTRLGVSGGSAGGHLSLLLATRGGPGSGDAPDPVDRESSAVQAVAIFYPVTDLLNLGSSTENAGDGGPPKSFVKAFGSESTNLSVWKVIGRELSPIYYIHSNLPPCLIFHGDADTLVPLDQSQRFAAEAERLGQTVKVVVHPGGGHGWPSMLWDLRQFGKWFDNHLLRPQR